MKIIYSILIERVSLLRNYHFGAKINLSINSPHQVETSSKHLEETLKIEEIPDTSKQSTNRMTQEQDFV